MPLDMRHGTHGSHKAIIVSLVLRLRIKRGDGVATSQHGFKALQIVDVQVLLVSC